MAQRKVAYPTQRQKFLDAVRELGTDESPDAFRRAVRKVATAPGATAKKAAKKPKTRKAR